MASRRGALHAQVEEWAAYYREQGYTEEQIAEWLGTPANGGGAALADDAPAAEAGAVSEVAMDGSVAANESAARHEAAATAGLDGQVGLQAALSGSYSCALKMTACMAQSAAALSGKTTIQSGLARFSLANALITALGPIFLYDLR